MHMLAAMIFAGNMAGMIENLLNDQPPPMTAEVRSQEEATAELQRACSSAR